MMHVMAPDEQRRRLASDTDLHTSERYDGASELKSAKSGQKLCWSQICQMPDLLEPTSHASLLSILLHNGYT